MSIAYFGKISAWLTCGYCDERILISSPSEVHCDEDELEEFGDKAKDDIEEAMELQGWVNGYCPECRTHYRKQIAAIERADDDL